MTLSLRSRLALCALGLALLSPPATVSAQEFAAVVSPPRFEDRTQPGKTYRNIIEITNISERPGRYLVETADWTLDDSGNPIFSQTLAAGSCRPWVAIESGEIRLAGLGKRRYRFEVEVPADAPRGECRFAIMIESEPQVVAGVVPLPVSGRIGVIVYLVVGEAAPALVLERTVTVEAAGRRLPALQVRNDGDMHGRLDGFLAAEDAKGQRFVLVPDNAPILPGARRSLLLSPQPASADPGVVPPPIAYPLRIRGRLDAERQRLEVEVDLDAEGRSAPPAPVPSAGSREG